MKNFNKKSNKKLALVVGAALSFGMAFGTMPYDSAEAATYKLAQNKDADYVLSKDGVEQATMSYGNLLKPDSALVKALAEDNTEIIVNDAKTATSLSGKDLTLGANSKITVNGSNSNATLVSGDTKSVVGVNGTNISGDDVNLKSVDVNAKGGQNVGINVSGKIDTITVAADEGNKANITFGGDVAVGSLSVAEGAKLNVAEGKTLTADSLTVANGATLTASDGTVKAGTLTLSEGATIASGASVAVNEIVVDASNAEAVKNLTEAIKNMKVSSADGDGGTVKVKIDTTKITDTSVDDMQKLIDDMDTALKEATKDSITNTDVDTSIRVSANADGKFNVNGKTVEGKDLADAVTEAFKTTGQVTLDKDAVKAISNSKKGVTVPKGSTLVVSDTADGSTVSATPKNNAELKISGTEISAADGTEFENVTVDAKGATVTNTIKGATIDNVTVKSGNLVSQDATVKDLTVAGGSVNTADAKNGKITATNVTVNGGEVTVGTLDAETAIFNGGTINADVAADNVALGKGATVSAGSTISAKKLVVDDVNSLTGLTIQGKNGATLEITKAGGGKFTDDELKQIAAAVPEGTTVKANGETVKGEQGSKPNEPSKPGDNKGNDPAAVEAAKTAAEAAKTAKEAALKKVGGEYATMNETAVTKMATANPFAAASKRLPSASEISAMSNASKDTLTSLSAAKEQLTSAATKYAALAKNETDATKRAEYTKLANDLQTEAASLLTTDTALKAQAAKLTAAAQYAGKTAAAPGATASRTASVITSVMTNNVTARTNELRSMAAAIDDGREEADNVWFQFKHTDVDVDNGGTYAKSKVNTNNLQLGYDTKLGPNDYLGAYIGTTTGSADFNGPSASGSTDIDNAYDLGLYGTHMLPAGQYIDYMLHTGSFDSKYNGEKWGTTDTGAMVGYGMKIEQNTRLTLNPYVQLAYDHIGVGSYKAGNNQITSKDSDNWTAKLGVNLLDVSGFYGGLAYSRGLSGSYNAYINGVPMPSSDNNANVVYLNLGYRANVARNTLLDLSMEKTFVDYDGWTAAGKVNFYF